MANKAKNHVIYVYGTLRPGGDSFHFIPGHMYDIGWFPGVTLGGPGCNSSFVAERIVVSDDRLKEIDGYEGFNPNSPETSLYLRKPCLDGWIYTYNREITSEPVVVGGDWLAYKQSKKGLNAHLGQEKELEELRAK
jgi:gamma-glutamylcyclotransferase (GGCT)/AIG2-like uncharacterized protein YtfP